MQTLEFLSKTDAAKIFCKTTGLEEGYTERLVKLHDMSIVCKETQETLSEQAASL